MEFYYMHIYQPEQSTCTFNHGVEEEIWALLEIYQLVLFSNGKSQLKK